jgi:hypothetical protein
MLRLGKEFFQPGPQQTLVIVPIGGPRAPPCRETKAKKGK